MDTSSLLFNFPELSTVQYSYIGSNGTVIFRTVIEKNVQTNQTNTRTVFPQGEFFPSSVRTYQFQFPPDIINNYESHQVHWFRIDGLLSNTNDDNTNCTETATMVVPVFKTNRLNIPNMIRCQNCETNYPTKYQYQRHQCEFNAEKVVLKSSTFLVPTNDEEPQLPSDDGTQSVPFVSVPIVVNKVKFSCTNCGKQFVTKGNLERHQATHEHPDNNTCEFCKKQFVSENRLRIHKENHCKKSGDTSKFYRSDVTVWKCLQCNEVFSSSTTANYHLPTCCATVPFIKIEIDNTDGTSRITTTNSSGGGGIEKISTEILLQCEFCNRTYADKTVLLEHQRAHRTDKNYECIICGEVFESYIGATQHWMKKCSEKANLFYLAKLMYCEVCDRTFKSHEILYTHKIKKRHYTGKLHIDKGAAKDHNVEKSTSTPETSLSQDALSKLVEDVLCALDVNKDQVSKYHDDELPALESCNKKRRGRKRKIPQVQPPPSNIKSFKTKRMTHSSTPYSNGSLNDGYKYQCERCASIFDSIPDLESHREREHATNFTCEECGQVLNSARSLLVHSRAHKSLKPYVCDTCGRSYSQTSHLWQHMRFHQGIKPFACPHEGCEARYTIRPDLKDHIRKVHTRERPFKCTVCGKCFLTGSVYYQHRLIHTEDRRYGCDMCEKRFFRADALNNHRRIHTNERPYPCVVCGRMFRQKGDRNKHFRTQHPDALLPQS